MPSPLTVTVSGVPRQVAEDTTAADLFAGDRSVVVARVNGELRDLAHVPSPTAMSSSRSGRLRRTAWPCCATPPRTCWPRRCRSCTPRPGSASARRSATASTTTSTSSSRSPRRTSRRSRRSCSGSSTRDRPSVAGSSPRTRRAPSWPDEPYKLELIGLKGGRPTPRPAEGAEVEVGGGELTIYDNVAPGRRRVAWQDLCRGPHLPTTKLIGNGFKLMRIGGGVLAGEREEPAAAAHLRHRVADQGRPARPTSTRLAEAERRDHRQLGAELDLFSLPGRDRLGPGGVPPQGRHPPQGDGGLLAPAARGGRLRVRLHPAHHQGAAVRDHRTPRLVRRRRCSRRCTWTRSATPTAPSASRGRTTTSSR